MIKRIILIVFIVLITAFPQRVYASEMTVEDVADMFQLEETDDGIREITTEYGLSEFSIKETVLELLSGKTEFSISGIIKSIIRLVSGQASDVMKIMKKLVILILLSAILEIVSSSFSSEGVSRLGQNICTSVLIVTVMKSFYYAAQTAVTAVEKISSAASVLQPLFMLIMTAEGKTAKMTAAVPVLYSSSVFLNYIVKNLIVPCILFAALITFINAMSERDILLEFAELMKTVCKWSIRICAGIFIFIMSVIKIGVPDTALIAGNSIKTMANAIPVAGPVMASAAETAVAVTRAMGNSVTAAVMIFIIIISIVPVIRLSVIMFVYKLTAAITQPVASKRIVSCISRAADYTELLVGIVFTADIMFITVTALILAV